MHINVRNEDFELRRIQTGDYEVYDDFGVYVGKVWNFGYGTAPWRHSKLTVFNKGDKTRKASIDELVYFHQNNISGFEQLGS